MPEHYLRPLLAPHSVALVGATERSGALGAIVYHNLASGGLHGMLYAVNPKHRKIFGKRAYPRLSALPQRPDLAVIVTPPRTVPGIIEDAGAARIPAAVILTSGFGETGAEGRALQEAVLAAARRGGVRLLGPNCLGLMRTEGGLNATFARSPALEGNLALV
jgi:acetyltransferase